MQEQDQVQILVIDDEQIMRDGCSRILSKGGVLKGVPYAERNGLSLRPDSFWPA